MTETLKKPEAQETQEAQEEVKIPSGRSQNDPVFIRARELYTILRKKLDAKSNATTVSFPEKELESAGFASGQIPRYVRYISEATDLFVKYSYWEGDGTHFFKCQLKKLVQPTEKPEKNPEKNPEKKAEKAGKGNKKAKLQAAKADQDKAPEIPGKA